MKNKYYNYVYKTTNIINNMFYIGRHSTCKLHDNYMGSGKKLKQAIREFGEENFVKEILQHFPDSIKASECEIKLTTFYYQHPMCYNMEISAKIINKI